MQLNGTARLEGAGMLKAFQLEKDFGVQAQGFFFQRHHWSPPHVHGNTAACILNFSARDHPDCARDFVFTLTVATGCLGRSSTISRKMSGRA